MPIGHGVEQPDHAVEEPRFHENNEHGTDECGHRVEEDQPVDDDEACQAVGQR